jgi:hypothetical protein
MLEMVLVSKVIETIWSIDYRNVDVRHGRLAARGIGVKLQLSQWIFRVVCCAIQWSPDRNQRQKECPK